MWFKDARSAGVLGVVLRCEVCKGVCEGVGCGLKWQGLQGCMRGSVSFRRWEPWNSPPP